MNETFLLAFYNHLVTVAPTIIERIYASTNFANGELIPTNPDGQALDISSQQVEIYNADMRGETDVMDEIAGDIQEVEIVLGRDTVPTWYVPAAFSYTHRQVQAATSAAKNGSPFAANVLTDMPSNAAAQVITRKLNLLAAYGRGNTPGLLNNTSVPSLTDTTTLPYASATPSQDLLDWIIEQIETVLVRNNTEDDWAASPDTLLLPSGLRKRMRSVATTNNSDSRTLEDRLLSAYPNITRIHYSGLLSAANLEANGVQAPGLGHDRLLIYRRDPLFVSRRVSILDPIMPSYNKGRYWSGYGQSASATVFHQPQFAQVVRFQPE